MEISATLIARHLRTSSDERWSLWRRR